jgi:hypothetical protein
MAGWAPPTRGGGTAPRGVRLRIRSTLRCVKRPWNRQQTTGHPAEGWGGATPMGETTSPPRRVGGACSPAGVGDRVA